MELRTLPKRFWTKIDWSDPSGCWLWTGGLTTGGYGQMYSGGFRWYAHRLAYEGLVGPIPEGLQIDHLCRVRNCVNPEHLEPVTSRENTMRGDNWSAKYAKMTTCAKGHSFDAVTKDGKRKCKTCRRGWENARRARLKNRTTSMELN